MTDIRTELTKHNLAVLGWFVFDQDLVLPTRKDLLGCGGILVGNFGPKMWRSFKVSPEYADALDDSMNRWTKRILDDVGQHGQAIEVLYPFDRPFWPFQRILSAATGAKQSPVGQYIHPVYGLWHAVRGVFVYNSVREIDNIINCLPKEREYLNHPCDVCKDKPCLTACPVGAFDDTSLNVETCHTHLASGEEPDCLTLGCRARGACPVGEEHVYDSDQIQFHMGAYFAR